MAEPTTPEPIEQRVWSLEVKVELLERILNSHHHPVGSAQLAPSGKDSKLAGLAAEFASHVIQDDDAWIDDGTYCKLKEYLTANYPNVKIVGRG